MRSTLLLESEISTERFVVSPATTGGFTRVDTREVLRHALQQLSVKQRAVITLRYFEGPSEAETLPLFKFLGTNPANWTTHPLAS